jgi:hypothetical protein
MTRDERAAARQCCEEATEGPWEAYAYGVRTAWTYMPTKKDGTPYKLRHNGPKPRRAQVVYHFFAKADPGSQLAADHAFIARARADLPAALDELDRLTPAWSADTPTRPGWYWFRDEPGDEPDVVEVFVVDARLRVFDGAEVVDAAEWGGEWAGPIPPPA